MTQQDFELVVDRNTRTLEKVIEAGDYGRNDVSSDINSKRCPNVRAETVGKATVFHFDEELTTDKYREKLAKLGYRGADMFELAAFGEQFPDEQLNYPILEVDQDVRGSSGDVCVGCLDRWGGKRRLSLYLRDDRWRRRCRVLAFRK